MLDNLAILIHYGLIAFVLLITILSVCMGPGLIGRTAIEESNTQPDTSSDIQTALILGIAMIETIAIIGGLTAFFMFVSIYQAPGLPSIYFALSEIGMVCALVFSSLTFGLVCPLPIRAACTAIARQPLFATKIIRLMLASLCLLITPVIFAFITAFFIRGQALQATTFADALRLIGAGLSIGLGSIGPLVGLGLLARGSCQAIGTNKSSYQVVVNITLISQIFAETPVIFALVTSIAMLFTPSSIRSSAPSISPWVI